MILNGDSRFSEVPFLKTLLHTPDTPCQETEIKTEPMSSTSETHSFDSDLGYKTELHRVLKHLRCILRSREVAWERGQCAFLLISVVVFH